LKGEFSIYSKAHLLFFAVLYLPVITESKWRLSSSSAAAALFLAERLASHQALESPYIVGQLPVGSRLLSKGTTINTSQDKTERINFPQADAPSTLT
jgi:hypothetical protein